MGRKVQPVRCKELPWVSEDNLIIVRLDDPTPHAVNTLIVLTFKHDVVRLKLGFQRNAKPARSGKLGERLLFAWFRVVNRTSNWVAHAWCCPASE